MKFLTPKTLDEALKIRGQHPDYTILAGGTDICVAINSGQVQSKGIINIWGIGGLSGIRDAGNFVDIGALATHSDIFNSEPVKKFVPALAEACKTVGARQIQNRGTIGGNVMNASPAGDTLPVLLAYEAVVKVAGLAGSRSISFKDFYKGYRKTVLAADELVTGFSIPKAAAIEKAQFLKVGTRRAQAISKVMACFRIMLEGSGICAGSENAKVKDVAIAYGSVAPVPIRLVKTEGLLRGNYLNGNLIEKAVLSAKGEVSPIDDIRSNTAYRRHVSGSLLKMFLESL